MAKAKKKARKSQYCCDWVENQISALQVCQNRWEVKGAWRRSKSTSAMMATSIEH